MMKKFGSRILTAVLVSLLFACSSSQNGQEPSVTRNSTPSRFRAIVIGDSLASRGWGPGGNVTTLPGNGFVVTGGPLDPVATVTTTNPHALLPGNFVHIFNVGDSTYSAALNGTVVRVLTTASPTQFTVSAVVDGQAMPNGDYSSGYLGQGWIVHSMYQVTDESWLQWLNQYMKGRFTFVASYAQGGTTSAVGLSVIPKIRRGPQADYAFIQYCTNDVNAALPQAAQCLDNTRALVSAVDALGMIPVLCAPPAIGAIGASPDPATAAKSAALTAIRDGMQQIALANPQVIFLDTLSQTADPTDTLLRFKHDYAPVDGIHLSSFGAAAVAKHFASILQNTIPLVDALPVSIADDASLDPRARNILQNGLMTGTGGSIASTVNNIVSGTAPTGWALATVGGTTAAPMYIRAISNVPHTDMYGSSLDIEIDSANRGQGFQVGSNGMSGSSFGSRMRAGDWYRCGFQAIARTEIRNLNLSGQVFLNFGNGNTPSIYFMTSTNPTFENGVLIEADETLTLTSQPFYLATVPTAGAYLFIHGRFSGPSNQQTLSLGRAFCYAVEDPYR